VARRQRPPLSKPREAWAAQRAGHLFRGSPLSPSAATRDKYSARLEKLVELMATVTQRALVREYKRPIAAHAGVAMDAPSFVTAVTRLLRELEKRFVLLFTEQAGGLTAAMMKGVSDTSASQLGDSLKAVSGGLTLKTDMISGTVAEVFKASVRENVALIKSIPAKYFEQIQGDVMRSIQTGQGMTDLLPQIEQYEGVTKRRAKLIAEDQTRKATTALNRVRMQAAGMRQFEWLHSGGGKEPRELHVEMDGKVYDLDNPPIIDERTGERGLPGQLINCRCRMVPVISFGGPKP